MIRVAGKTKSLPVTSYWNHSNGRRIPVVSQHERCVSTVSTWWSSSSNQRSPLNPPMLSLYGNPSNTNTIILNYCHYFSTVSSSSTTVASPKPIGLPPNLKIDPKSTLFNIRSGTSINQNRNAPKISKKPIFVKSNNKEKSDSSEQVTTEKASPAVAPTESPAASPEVSAEEVEEHEEEIVDDIDDDIDVTSSLLLHPNEVTYAKPLPDRLNMEIHTLFAPQHSSLVGTIWLNDTVFGIDPVRIDLLKRAVDYYRATKRGKRNAHTKTISEVSGSGRKIRQQKGTGRARAGHSRPAHHRGGAKAHGPNKHRNTDYSNVKLNRKVRQAALRSVLSQKLKEGNIILLNELYSLPTYKTNDLAKYLYPWNVATGKKDGYTALILDHYYPEASSDETDEATADTTETSENKKNAAAAATSYDGVPTNLYVASSNLYQLKVSNDMRGACVYDILKYDKLILTLAALEQLEARLKD